MAATIIPISTRKPIAVVVDNAQPYASYTHELRLQVAERYRVAAMARYAQMLLTWKDDCIGNVSTDFAVEQLEAALKSLKGDRV